MDSPRISSLSDVPEEVNISRSSSPYVHPAMSISTSGFKAHPSTSSLASLASASRSPSGPRNPIGLRSASTPTATKFSDTASIAGTSIAGVMTSSSTQKSRSKSPGSTTMRDRERDKERDGDKEKDGKDGKEGKSGQGSKGSRGLATQPRLRNTPHLPSGKDVEPVPATLMYWSRAPVYGLLPTHGMRAHSITLVDNIAWIFGGCDEKGCWRDVWCFSVGASSLEQYMPHFIESHGVRISCVESMQWSNPDTVGDIPPPCRAHTATLVDRRIVVFGGGEGPVYYSNLYVLDTITRRWQHPTFPEGTDLPPPRRAHTSVLYRGRIYVFGGGNGTQALNDLWTLEVGTNANVEKMRWEEQQTRGRKPSPRGYHTANLIGNVMIVMGGSDGRECFSDMWCLNLGTHSLQASLGDHAS